MIDGHLMEQLNEALLDAYPAVRALRMLVRFECNENLDAFAPVDDLEAAVFELTRRAEAHNWLGKLVRGARARNPGNELLRAAAEALGHGAPGATEPPSPPPAIDLAWPFKFDMEAQVGEVNGTLPAGGLVGYAVPDDTEEFLTHLRERLANDLGRDRTYCYPTTLRVSEVKLPPEVALRTILSNAKGRLPTHDVIFFITGWRSPAQVKAFWANLKGKLAQMAMPHALAIIFAFDPVAFAPADLPAEVIPLTPPRFTDRHLHAWIRAQVAMLGWPPPAIDFWRDTVLHCALLNGELVAVWVYDHLRFADTELRRSSSYEQWKLALRQWSESYA